MSKAVAYHAYQAVHYERLAAESDANNAHNASLWTGDRTPALSAIARAEAIHARELELYEAFQNTPDDSSPAAEFDPNDPTGVMDCIGGMTFDE